MNASFQCNETGYSKLSEQLSWQPENFYEYYQMTPDTFTVKLLHKIRNEALFHAKNLISTSRNSCEYFASSVTISIGSYRFVLIGRVRSISRELDFANKLSLNPTYPRIQRDLSHQVHTDFAYPQQFLWIKVPWTLSWPFTSVLILKLRMPGVLPPLSLWVTPMTWLGTLCYPSISFINLLTKGDKTRVFAIQNGPFQLTG